MSLDIYSDGEIMIDGRKTDLFVIQKDDCTVVYCPSEENRKYEMPQKNYNLLKQAPVHLVAEEKLKEHSELRGATRDDDPEMIVFERDLKKLLGWS